MITLRAFSYPYISASTSLTIYITGKIITPQGNMKEKKSNVFPARILDINMHEVKTPVNIAYRSVLVRFSNMIILYFQT